jgi:hypothetical protein
MILRIIAKLFAESSLSSATRIRHRADRSPLLTRQFVYLNLRRHHRQTHDELAPLAVTFAASLDVAAVHLHQPPHERQADAQAALRSVRTIFANEVPNEENAGSRECDKRRHRVCNHLSLRSRRKRCAMSDSERCESCGGKLRTAIFCLKCGLSFCCYACLDAHVARHPPLTATKPFPEPPPALNRQPPHE